jgi:hypothetical protein
MGSRWDSSDYRSGYFAGRNRERKQRLLWILLGFTLREIALFVVYSLSHA